MCGKTWVCAYCSLNASSCRRSSEIVVGRSSLVIGKHLPLPPGEKAAIRPLNRGRDECKHLAQDQGRTTHDDYCISSIRSSATFAQRFTSSRTLIWLTMFPSTRFSSVQHKCCGEMRNMVVHRHPESSSVITFFPSAANSLPMRFTRWISVPTANMLPEGAWRII